MKTNNEKVNLLIDKITKGYKLKYQDLMYLNELELNLLRIFKKNEVDTILHPPKIGQSKLNKSL